jgi:hypothetical protein
MPTTRPRYQITDTGEVSEMLDLAEKVWPGRGRKELLVRLAALGRDELAGRSRERDEAERSDRQRVALERAAELVDAERLLGDAAWR